MISLIYLSSAIKKLSEAELLELLHKSEENNQALGVTGLLLYRDGNFLQVLEGEADVVRALYEKICKDPRHRGILKVSERPIQRREFGEWQMGFVNLETVKPEDVPGYSDYLQTPLTADEFADNPTFARVFVESFKMVGQ